MTLPSSEKSEFPWWLLAIGVIGIYLCYRIFTDALYIEVFNAIYKGVGITIFVTLFAFSFSLILGLLLATASLSRYTILRQFARFYTEVIRGIPVIVLLFYIAFVFSPLLVTMVNYILEPLGIDPMRARDLSYLWRAILALVICYSAFIAEVLRAGIKAVPLGQIEAAKALGLSPWARFRFVIWPQAFRTILPPLGNDFIALIKDSSLVSVLGVADIAQLGKIYAAGSFRFFETYNIVAFIYLIMTIGLSLALRRLEAHLKIEFNY